MTSHFDENQKYNGPIPQIKYLPVHAIDHSGSSGEVRRVSDDVAKNMDFLEPVEATAFRYDKNNNDEAPNVQLSDGHHRFAAAKQIGKPHLPVSIIARNATGKKLNALKALSDEIEGRIHKAGGGSVGEEDQGITAYHGSPHEFEQFDLSKIGTGEGAQAYGHGLYFAEAEPVAKEYRNKLTSGTYKTSEGGIFDPSDLEHLNLRVAGRQGIDEALSKANELMSSQPQNAGMIQRDIAKLTEAQEKAAAPHAGHMYEVAINAHPDHFLDWDKPFVDQSSYVKDILKTSGLMKEYTDNLSDFSTPMATRNRMKRGENIHAFIEHKMGKDSEKASQYLADLGIKGIKYLDEKSRDKRRGTRNYVVFDDKLVNVKRRYARGGEVESDMNGYRRGGKVDVNELAKATIAKKQNGKVHPDLKMDVPIGESKERMSKMRANVPVRWASSPDHASAHLAYITDAEAELLKKADLHDSNIAHEHHVGPGGIPSYQGGGIGAGGSTGSGSSGVGGVAGSGGIGGGGGGGGSSSGGGGGGGGGGNGGGGLGGGGGGGGSGSMAAGRAADRGSVAGYSGDRGGSSSASGGYGSIGGTGGGAGGSNAGFGLSGISAGGGSGHSDSVGTIGGTGGGMAGSNAGFGTSGISAGGGGRGESYGGVGGSTGWSGTATNYAGRGGIGSDAVAMANNLAALPQFAGYTPAQIMAGMDRAGITSGEYAGLNSGQAAAFNPDVSPFAFSNMRAAMMPGTVYGPVGSFAMTPGTTSATQSNVNVGSLLSAVRGWAPGSTSGMSDAELTAAIVAGLPPGMTFNPSTNTITNNTGMSMNDAIAQQGGWAMSSFNQANPVSGFVSPVSTPGRGDFGNISGPSSANVGQGTTTGGGGGIGSDAVAGGGRGYGFGPSRGGIGSDAVAGGTAGGTSSGFTQPGRPFSPTPSTAYGGGRGQTGGGTTGGGEADTGTPPSTGGGGGGPDRGGPRPIRKPRHQHEGDDSQTTNFRNALSQAKKNGSKTFRWTDPSTGQTNTYQTALNRKQGGRIPSMKNPNEWIAHRTSIDPIAKARGSRTPSKINGTAIVNRAVMLSSRKS